MLSGSSLSFYHKNTQMENKNKEQLLSNNLVFRIQKKKASSQVQILAREVNYGIYLAKQSKKKLDIMM